jgi:hypothetical protein
MGSSGRGHAFRVRWLGATCLVIACGGTTSKSGDASGGFSGVGGAGGTGSGPQPAGGAQASQGGKASPAGGVSSAGAISAGGVPAGSAGLPAVAGTAGAPQGCFPDSLPGKSDFGNPGWAKSFFVTGCKSIADDGSCTLATECPNLGVQSEERFPIGGPPGQRYKVAFRFSAVVEAKEYSGGKRDAGASEPADLYGGIWDSFYRDGVPLPTARNAWKLTVYDNNGQEARHYYLNSFPTDTGLVVDGHTFLVQFKKSILVIGGGWVSHTIHAPACRAENNCGAIGVVGAGGEGGAAEVGDCLGTPRNMPAPDNTAMLPAFYRDLDDEQIKSTPQLSAYGNGSLAQPWHSQVGTLTVLSVECSNDPLTTDYPDPP